MTRKLRKKLRRGSVAENKPLAKLPGTGEASTVTKEEGEEDTKNYLWKEGIAAAHAEITQPEVPGYEVAPTHRPPGKTRKVDAKKKKVKVCSSKKKGASTTGNGTGPYTRFFKGRRTEDAREKRREKKLNWIQWGPRKSGGARGELGKRPG